MVSDHVYFVYKMAKIQFESDLDVKYVTAL